MLTLTEKSDADIYEVFINRQRKLVTIQRKKSSSLSCDVHDNVFAPTVRTSLPSFLSVGSRETYKWLELRVPNFRDQWLAGYQSCLSTDQDRFGCVVIWMALLACVGIGRHSQICAACNVCRFKVQETSCVRHCNLCRVAATHVLCARDSRVCCEVEVVTDRCHEGVVHESRAALVRRPQVLSTDV